MNGSHVVRSYSPTNDRGSSIYRAMVCSSSPSDMLLYATPTCSPAMRSSSTVRRCRVPCSRHDTRNQMSALTRTACSSFRTSVLASFDAHVDHKSFFGSSLAFIDNIFYCNIRVYSYITRGSLFILYYLACSVNIRWLFKCAFCNPLELLITSDWDTTLSITRGTSAIFLLVLMLILVRIRSSVPPIDTNFDGGFSAPLCILKNIQTPAAWPTKTPAPSPRSRRAFNLAPSSCRTRELFATVSSPSMHASSSGASYVEMQNRTMFSESSASRAWELYGRPIGARRHSSLLDVLPKTNVRK